MTKNYNSLKIWSNFTCGFLRPSDIKEYNIAPLHSKNRKTICNLTLHQCNSMTYHS